MHLAERVRIEHTSTRKRADNGFEDREGHQAPITLREKRRRKSQSRKGALPNIPYLPNKRIPVREFASSDFGIHFLSINDNFEHAAAGRDQLQDGNAMFQFEQFIRQTDGMWLIISIRAILYGNLQRHV